MKNKKIVSVVFAIVLCLTATIIVVTANTKTINIELLTDKPALSAGETATISVKVTSNFPVATMSIPVFYDKNLVSVSDATATLTNYAVKNTTTDSQRVDFSKIYANTTVNKESFGFVLVNYIGSAGAEVPEFIDEAVLTFKITAKENIEGEVVVKCVSESIKTGNNVAGMLYFGSTTNGTVINSIPENVENIDVTEATTTVAITNLSTPNTIAIREDAPYNPIIDTVNKGEFTGTIYGVDTLGWDDTLEADGTLADFLTTAYGDEYLEIVVGDIGVETTGTIINVLDENGNAIETYVFVYFGDMDMDGAVGFADALIAEFYEMNFTGIDTLYQFMAGDLDGDTIPGFADALVVEFFELNYYGIANQAEIGAVASGNEYIVF